MSPSDNAYYIASLILPEVWEELLCVVSLCCVQGGSIFISQDAGLSFEEVRLPTATAVWTTCYTNSQYINFIQYMCIDSYI